MRSVDLFGQRFRLADKPNRYALTRFMAMAGKQGDVDEATASATLMDFLQRCIHADDWHRFDQACLDNDAEWETDLLPIVGMVYEQATDRPTQRPSGSSDGPLSTRPKSTDVSSSQGTDPYLTEIEELNRTGRRDLALFLVDAQEQRTA